MSAGEWMPAVVLDEMQARIDALEAENAALWTFVRAWEDVERGLDDFALHDDQVLILRGAREALRQYEAQR